MQGRGTWPWAEKPSDAVADELFAGCRADKGPVVVSCCRPSHASAAVLAAACQQEARRYACLHRTYSTKATAGWAGTLQAPWY
jgi:hypothetical protein